MTTIQKVRYTHDAMIDLIIADPTVSQNEIASFFGYTPAWISIVMSSDAFRERLASRRGELIDPRIQVSINDRFRAVVERGLEILGDKLANPSHTVPDNLVLKAVELGAKGISVGGFGNVAPAQPAAPSNHLEQLAQRLLALQSSVKGNVIDGELVSVQNAA